VDSSGDYSLPVPVSPVIKTVVLESAPERLNRIFLHGFRMADNIYEGARSLPTIFFRRLFSSSKALTWTNLAINSAPMKASPVLYPDFPLRARFIGG